MDELAPKDTDRSNQFPFPADPFPTQPEFRQAVADIERRLVLGLLALDEAHHADRLGDDAEHVARTMRVSSEHLKSRSRTQHVAFCRQVAMHLCRKLTRAPFEAIGPHFNRDHASVIHSCNLIGQRIQRDAAFRLLIEKLERDITGTVPATAAAA